MIGSMNCVYETPCGWCSKWDKKCDMKIPERGQRVNVSPVDDAMANKACVSEEDHEWECCGVSTEGMDYVCKNCGKHKRNYFESVNDLSKRRLDLRGW